MSKKSSYLVGLLMTIIIGSILQYFLCCKNCEGTCNGKNNSYKTTEVIHKKPTRTPATLNSLNISDNSSGLAFQSNDNFNFLKNNYTIKDSVSNTISKQIDKLGIYLNNNENKQVNIEGLYNTNEVNHSVFPNLGYARANSIKNYFVSKGISSKQVNLFGLLDDTFTLDTLNVFHGPVNFTVKTLKDNSNQKENLQKLKDSLMANPLTLYFKIGSNTLTINKIQRQKVADLLTYVEKSNNNKLIVTGHTDNTAIGAKNIELAQERADFVKSILNSNGISESYIITNSKGSDQPIADNATEEGKAKNRRVSITIN